MTASGSLSRPCLLPEGRLIFLDALRGLAALAVVVFHLACVTRLRAPLSSVLPAPVMLLFEQGRAGVAVFFALSGFVIARSLTRAGTDVDVDLRFFGRFALRRSLRLDPPYWCAVALAASLMTLAAVFPEAPARPTFGEIAAHFAYLQDILGLRALALQFWTLPYELQFYLVACGCLGLEQVLRRRLARTWGADKGATLAPILAHAPLVIVSGALAMCAVSTRGWFLDLWYQFALGALTCRMLEGRVSRALWCASVLVVATGGALLGSVLVEMMVATCVLIVVVAWMGGLATWGSWAPLQWMGRASYSLYLTHFVAFVMCQGLALKIDLTGMGALLVLLAGLAVSLAIAWAFHRFIEAPSLALSRSPHPLSDLRAMLPGRRRAREGS